MSRVTAEAWANVFVSMGVRVVAVVGLSEPDKFALDMAHGRLASEHDCKMFEAGFHAGRGAQVRTVLDRSYWTCENGIWEPPYPGLE